METTVILNREQELALQLMLSGKNVFVFGNAGAGKSTVIEAFKRCCAKRLVCLAPTGIAALNIQGSTIHRFFGFPGMVNDFICQQSARNNYLMFNALDVILIDEISMVRSDLFAAIDLTLRLAASGPAAQLPFGGKQIIVVGDCSQLPPVIEDWQVQTYLEANFGGIHAFQTTSWRNAAFQPAVLTETLRVRDPRLLEIVNAIRTGVANQPIAPMNPTTLLDLLNTRCLPLSNLDDRTISLCSHNELAAQINAIAIQQIPAEPQFFTGSVVGEFPANDRPTDINLPVKLGMRVMLRANQAGCSTPFAYVNGMTGTVVNCGKDFGRPYVTIRFNDGREETINEYTWTNYEYELEQDGQGNFDLTQKPVGTFTQLPISPAYGFTVHKSQGLTITDPVCVMLDSQPCFVPGLLYVALTRCRSLDQITLNRPVSCFDCLQNPAVQWFYDDLGLK